MKSKDGLNKSHITVEGEKLDLGSLSIEDIDKYIQILSEYEEKCNREHKFVEANLAKNKVLELQKTKEIQSLKRLERKQEEQKAELENKQVEELRQFNQKMDLKFFELTKKFSDLQNQLMTQQEKDMEELKKNFNEETVSSNPKPSGELINLNKQMDLYSKKKDYENAHNIQLKIIKLSEEEHNNYMNQRNEKLNKEINNLKIKQQNETNALNLKIEAQYNQNKITRANELEKLLLKFKIQLRDLNKLHQHDKEEMIKLHGETKTGQKSFNRTRMNATNRRMSKPSEDK